MANSNRPSGFTPVSDLNGATWTGQARIYSIAATYNTALYIGDPVKSSGTADANGVAGIVLGSTTGALRGVIVGLGNSGGTAASQAAQTSLFNFINPNITYRPASDPNIWYAAVVDDPQTIFTIQEESNGTQIAATEIELNTISKTGTGNGFVSGWQLPSASAQAPATTASLQLKLLGLVQMPAGTNVFGPYAKHLVKINVHELGTGDGSSGV